MHGQVIAQLKTLILTLSVPITRKIKLLIALKYSSALFSDLKYVKFLHHKNCK